MTQEYVPVACNWIWHPKVLGVSTGARGLWISGLCYAGTTDGFIPESVLPRLAADIKTPLRRRYAVELVSAELWEVVADGYHVHDFEDHCAWLSDRRMRDRERQQRRRERLSTSRDSSVTRHVTKRDTSVTVTPEREREQEHEQLTPKPPAGDVALVWGTWVKSTGRGACKLDDKRKRLITARLRDYPLDDVVAAVQGWERDPWEGRRQQNEIAILLRDNAHLEKFRDLWRQPALMSTAVGAEGYTGPTELARKFW